MNPVFDANSPVGVLDSGIGGFSVARAVQQLRPASSALSSVSTMPENTAFGYRREKFSPNALKSDVTFSSIPGNIRQYSK